MYSIYCFLLRNVLFFFVEHKLGAHGRAGGYGKHGGGTGGNLVCLYTVRIFAHKHINILQRQWLWRIL